MVANVIENAMKHSPAGASVGLTTIRSPSAIAVSVMDSGPGIPVADRGPVFRRFYRLESSRSTPGSGLGLSLVAAIAALHQVSIELIDNRPGLRVTLRFFAADQRMLAGDRLAKHQTKGEPSPAGHALLSSIEIPDDFKLEISSEYDGPITRASGSVPPLARASGWKQRLAAHVFAATEQ